MKAEALSRPESSRHPSVAAGKDPAPTAQPLRPLDRLSSLRAAPGARPLHPNGLLQACVAWDKRETLRGPLVGAARGGRRDGIGPRGRQTPARAQRGREEQRGPQGLGGAVPQQRPAVPLPVSPPPPLQLPSHRRTPAPQPAGPASPPCLNLNATPLGHSTSAPFFLPIEATHASFL